jgi:UDP-N-acetyl-D-mannosaminuronate dehydrogenase
MKVGIIGQGYVGLTISAFAGEFFEVVGYDKNETVVNQHFQSFCFTLMPHPSSSSADRVFPSANNVATALT